jgi:VWFA-related protein
VTIEAVVTDAKGQPILDLKAADFELLENGVVQKIGVELRRSPRGASAADAFPIQSDSDEERAARQPGTRAFAIFLDEFHVSAGVYADRVRAALTQYIDEQLQPADIAIVIKPLDALTSLRFTRDHDALRTAVAGFAGRKGDYTPRTPFEEEYIGRAPVAVQAARVQIATAAVRALAMRLGELRADRGVFVVVSEGFPRGSPAGRTSRPADLQGVVRAASRFHFPMYAFNPADLEPEAPAASGEAAERDSPIATLQWLASQTGGVAVLDGRTLADGLRRMTGDLAAYYVLTYQPAEADGRFHRVEVRAKRRDAQVRTPPGYWAPLGSEGRTALASSSARFTTPRRALHRSTLIDVWTGVTRSADGRTRVRVTWEPRVSTSRAPQVVVLQAQTAAGAPLFQGNVAQVGAAGAPDNAVFDAPAGRIELDLTVLGIDGAKLDSDARDIVVPVLDPRTKSPVLLTPEVVRARTMREFIAASANPDATPTPDRTFSRSDHLLIRVPAWDASGTDIQVSASLLNRSGQPMRALEPTGAIPGTTLAQFDLPLSWLAPGDYLIAMSAKNTNGDAVERISIHVTR